MQLEMKKFMKSIKDLYKNVAEMQQLIIEREKIYQKYCKMFAIIRRK